MKIDARPNGNANRSRIVTTAAIVAALSSLLLAGLAIFQNRAAVTSETALIGLQSEIRRLDEVLTMSARMHAATGDVKWKDRYLENLKPLDSAIEETRRLSVSVLGTDLMLTTDLANRALIDIENRAFELVAVGQNEEATALLSSTEYNKWKAEYAGGMDGLWKALSIHASDRVRSGRTLFVYAIVFVVLSLILATIAHQLLPRHSAPEEFIAELGQSVAVKRPWPITIGAAGALICCLCLTGMVVHRGYLNDLNRARTEFERQADRLINATQVATRVPIHLLNGARGVYVASENVTQDEFRAYFELRDFGRLFPSISNFGYIQPLERDQAAAFAEEMHANGSPDFQIKECHEHHKHYFVRYIEPLATNRSIWGTDLGEDADSRLAIERAIRSGEATISKPIRDKHLATTLASIQYYLPVYNNGAHCTTIEDRVNALRGVVFAIVNPELVLRDVAQSADDFIQLCVFDGRKGSSESMLFGAMSDAQDLDSLGGATQYKDRTFRKLDRLTIGGREWTVALISTPKFAATMSTHSALAEAIVGILVSVMFSLIIFLLGTARYRAVALARVMTVELARSKGILESALRETEALRCTIDAHSQVGITDTTGKIIDVNDALCRATGYEREELLGATHRVVKSGLQSEDLWERVWSKISAGDSWRGEVCNRRKNGDLYWTDTTIAPFKDSSGAIEKYVAISSEITERKRAEQLLLAAACTDKLTELPNRNQLNERITQALERARSDSDYRFAILFLDFDRFKLINDSLGHSMGDQFLKKMAERSNSVLKAFRMTQDGTHDDMVARLGGDEFVILMDGIVNDHEATELADQLLKKLSQRYELGDHTFHCALSIGIATSDVGANSPDEMLRNADIAMYEAKFMGGARHAVFNLPMLETVRSRHRLETDLHDAVERGEIKVLYQPIICLRTGSIISYEALVRWIHPELGMISPVKFIPITEETGYIVEVGRFVLEEACKLLCHLRTNCGGEKLSMNVNVSRRQLVEADFVPRLKKLLHRLQLPPHALRLEITESVVMAAPDSIGEALEEISAMGVQLHLDDFGTGLSSLSLLRDLPLDGLKIDKSFIDAASGNREAIAVLDSIVTLGRNLYMKVTAEGIETQDQTAMLLDLECDYAQGYLFGRPEPADEAEAILHQDFSVQFTANETEEVFVV